VTFSPVGYRFESYAVCTAEYVDPPPRRETPTCRVTPPDSRRPLLFDSSFTAREVANRTTRPNDDASVGCARSERHLGGH
jgi:hypothetical protein